MSETSLIMERLAWGRGWRTVRSARRHDYHEFAVDRCGSAACG